MDANHQDTANNNLTTTEDVEWVVSKNSKLLIPQHKNRRKRTFKVPFDWLNLIGVLLIPFVVTFVGLYATQQITQQQTIASDRQHQTDLQIARDQQRETVYQSYLDRMSDLLFNDKLAQSKHGDAVQDVARARTITALQELDSVRKGLLLEFLYEANLIGRVIVNSNTHKIEIIEAKIDLDGADLSHAELLNANLLNADLYRVNLSGADLRGAYLIGATLVSTDLRGANLTGAHLIDANLIGSNLFGANIQDADLRGANLTDAIVSLKQLKQAKFLDCATMPNGSVYP